MLSSSIFSLVDLDTFLTSKTCGGPKDQGLSVVGKGISVRNYKQASEGQASLKYDTLGVTTHSLGKVIPVKKICVPKICMNFISRMPENWMLRDAMLRDDA